MALLSIDIYRIEYDPESNQPYTVLQNELIITKSKNLHGCVLDVCEKWKIKMAQDLINKLSEEEEKARDIKITTTARKVEKRTEKQSRQSKKD